ncbi:MAG: DMT family transporter [Deltaproteobacteria bacterium]|nr:DMT family transporter [Deltaproteobacteria bacterium]MBW2072143.1 DMT family transporter [Deltaproteobacteria bacterium]
MSRSHRPQTTRPAFNPSLALVSGVLAVSTGSIFARLADAPALVIAAYRVGLASLILAPVACWRCRAELLSLEVKDYLLAVLAGLCLALHFGTWISSLDYTAVANSVVLVNTNPLWVGLFTPFVTGERLSLTMKVGIFMSVVGGAIIGMGDFATGTTALWGDFLALLGSVFAAFYLLLGRALRRKLSLLAYVILCYGSAAIILWLLILSLQLPITGYSDKTWAAFVGMALVSQIIGHSSYNWALKWFSTSLIAVSLLGEPIGATIMAYIIFDEGLSWTKYVGGIMILSAIYLAGRGEQASE